MYKYLWKNTLNVPTIDNHYIDIPSSLIPLVCEFHVLVYVFPLLIVELPKVSWDFIKWTM